MSSYPPSDNGSDFDSLSKIQQISLLMNPKALQAWSYVQDMRQKKEQRDRQKQIFQMELEDRNRRRAHEDFATQVTLQGMGALPVHPGVEGRFEAGLGGRGTVTAPNNQQYSLQSESQRYEQSKSAAAQAGTLRGIERSAEESQNIDAGKLLRVTYPAVGEMPETTFYAPREQFAQHAKAIRDLKNGKILAPTIRTDPQTGKTYFMGKDADSGELIQNEFPTAMTPKADTGKERLPTNAEIEKLMSEWAPDFYNSRGITPEVFEASKGAGSAVLGGGNPNASRVAAAAKELRAAATTEIKARIRNGATERPGVMMSPVPTKKMNPADEIKRVVKLGKPMPAKNVAAAAKGLGITEEEFSRLWHAAGGTITP